MLSIDVCLLTITLTKIINSVVNIVDITMNCVLHVLNLFLMRPSLAIGTLLNYGIMNMLFNSQDEFYYSNNGLDEYV